MVVVEGATLATFVKGPITMIIIGVLLNIVGLGIFCWVLFTLAVYALPFFAGVTAGIYSFQVGAGPFGAIVIGFAAAGLTPAAGQYAFSVARSRFVRLVIVLLFAVPAARAGYDVTLAFAHIGRRWARMSIVGKPAFRDVALRRPHLSPRWGQRPRAGDSEAPSSVRLGSAG